MLFSPTYSAYNLAALNFRKFTIYL